MKDEERYDEHEREEAAERETEAPESEVRREGEGATAQSTSLPKRPRGFRSGAWFIFSPPPRGGRNDR